jgi:hypothetical protein
MGALLDQFALYGVQFESAGDDKLRAIGPLTDELRTMIRGNKPALLAELVVADEMPSYFRWRVGDAQRWLEVRFSPPATRADVAALYPGLEAVPLPDVDEPETAAQPLLAPASAAQLDMENCDG